jgi:hypothetical protein
VRRRFGSHFCLWWITAPKRTWFAWVAIDKAIPLPFDLGFQNVISLAIFPLKYTGELGPVRKVTVQEALPRIKSTIRRTNDSGKITRQNRRKPWKANPSMIPENSSILLLVSQRRGTAPEKEITLQFMGKYFNNKCNSIHARLNTSTWLTYKKKFLFESLRFLQRNLIYGWRASSQSNHTFLIMKFEGHFSSITMWAFQSWQEYISYGLPSISGDYFYNGVFNSWKMYLVPVPKAQDYITPYYHTRTNCHITVI